MGDGQGYSVDVDALKDAGLGLADLLVALDELHVENIDCDRKFVGHAGLADSYESFTTRWQVGVDTLTKDGTELSRRLVDAAGRYIEAEQKHHEMLKQIVSGTGDDPGVGDGG